jgi:hypothetical protein
MAVAKGLHLERGHDLGSQHPKRDCGVLTAGRHGRATRAAASPIGLRMVSQMEGRQDGTRFEAPASHAGRSWGLAWRGKGIPAGAGRKVGVERRAGP